MRRFSSKPQQYWAVGLFSLRLLTFFYGHFVAPSTDHHTAGCCTPVATGEASNAVTKYSTAVPRLSNAKHTQLNNVPKFSCGAWHWSRRM